ncbi:MAG TPA: hypothetical protein G4O16_03785 [Dehalococcoidia bacterium]|nr:hypothetical protein [Dehalococcoidia bacterium]
MNERKYSRYFIKRPILPGKFCDRLVFFSRNYEAVGEKNFSVLWNCITEPFLMVENPHSHDFDQFLHFYGANPVDIGDFDAEVEISLGEEGEKHVITEPTVLHLPAGMIHCPLEFKVVNKPIIFMNVALTPEYVTGPPETKK